MQAADALQHLPQQRLDDQRVALVLVHLVVHAPQHKLLQTRGELAQPAVQCVAQRRVALKLPHQPLAALCERAVRLLRDEVAQVLSAAGRHQRVALDLGAHVRLHLAALRRTLGHGARLEEVAAHFGAVLVDALEHHALPLLLRCQPPALRHGAALALLDLDSLKCHTKIATTQLVAQHKVAAAPPVRSVISDRRHDEEIQ
mmetsp:Transcript_13641/g.33547  ORF Transcript_13641/g.33547 Transcript_13641/m.33547 type:complete len:201 (-) Transcript_13641:337-939(-)